MEDSKNKTLPIIGVVCLLVAICIIVCGVLFKKEEKKPDGNLNPVQEVNYLYEYGLLTKNQVNNLEEGHVPTSSTQNYCSYKLDNNKLVYNGKTVAENVKSYICFTLHAYYLNNSNELYYVEKKDDSNTSYLLAKNVKEFRTVYKKDDYDFAIYVSENGYDIHKRLDSIREYLIYKNIDGQEFFIDNVDNKQMDIKFINHIDLYCSNKEMPQYPSTYDSDEVVVNMVNDKSIVKNLLKDENGNDLIIKDAVMSEDNAFYYNKIYVLDEKNYLYVFDYNSIKTLKGKKVDESKVSNYIANDTDAVASTKFTFENGKELRITGELVFNSNVR